MKIISLLSSANNSRLCVALRPFTFPLMVGMGVGIATKNVGVGIAFGLLFAVMKGAFGQGAE